MPTSIDSAVDDPSKVSLETFIKSHWTILGAVLSIVFGGGAFVAEIRSTQAYQGQSITEVRSDIKGIKSDVKTLQATQEANHIDSVQRLSRMEGLLKQQAQQ